jgi:trans-aconitate methyltransferase
MIDGEEMIARGFAANAVSLREEVVAYRRSALLLAALELDLFSYVDEEGCQVEAIEERLSSSTLLIRLLVDALVSIGLLTKDADGVVRVPSSLRLLVTQNEAYIGDQLLAHRARMGQWMQIPELVRGQVDASSVGLEVRRGKYARAYLSLVARSNQPHVGKLTEYLSKQLPTIATILDVGGGHGLYSVELLRRLPEAHATVLDFPDVLEYCNELHSMKPEFKRLRLIPGDLFTQGFRQTFDLVMVNDVLHYFDLAEKQRALNTLWSLVGSKGTLAVSKFTLADNGTEPTENVLFSLKVHLDSGCGYLARDIEMAKSMEEATRRRPVVVPLGNRKTILHVSRLAQPIKRAGVANGSVEDK